MMLAMSDHRKLLQRAGEALYGGNWQSQLARALGTSDRTMRRWLAEPYDIQPGVWNDIDILLAKRAADLVKLRADLQALTGASAGR
jgi:hypothetical protein